MLGAVLHAAPRGESVTDLWWVLLAVAWVPPALAVLLHGRRGQRAVCLVGALVAGLVALPLVPYGYGLLQLPAVVVLAVAGRGPAAR